MASTVQYSPLEQSTLDLVAELLRGVAQRALSGLSWPDDAARKDELHPIASIVQRSAQSRHERQLEDEERAAQDDPGMPRTLEGKLQQLKQLQDILTTVQPDGTTMAEKVKDRTAITRDLRKAAALHKELSAEVARDRAAQLEVQLSMQHLHDLLLQWELGSAGHMPSKGMA